MIDYTIENLSNKHSRSQIFKVLYSDSNGDGIWYQLGELEFYETLKNWQVSSHCKVFVALDYSQKIVGMVRIDRCKHQRRKHVAIIGPIAVLPEFQNVGIGSTLLDTSIQSYEEHEIKRIEARTIISSTLATTFFLKNGFHKEGIEEKAILNNNGVPHDLICLVKFV